MPRSKYATALTILGIPLLFTLLSCGDSPSGTPAGAVVGRAAAYDYSPSIILKGGQLQLWWCGKGRNPEKQSQMSDTILYETIDTLNGRQSKPIIVLGETPGSWDAIFTCNPRVIGGAFTNPLGDGQTYQYEMFYVATAAPTGVDNSIGAAFSHDGVTWTKYRDPVILSTSPNAYGVGQPVVYNTDGKSDLVLLYEDTTPTLHHVKATTADGIHFTVEGTSTTNGLDLKNPTPSWGDAGYDPVTKCWYAAFNLPVRNPGTTGNLTEYGQYGIQLYRIPDSSLLSGAMPWQLLQTFDTNWTGNEENFIAGFLKDPFGNLNVGAYPQIRLYPSMSNPRPAWNDDGKALASTAEPVTWDIGVSSYIPDHPTVTLARFLNDSSYNVTTGYLDPNGNYKRDKVIGHLYLGPQNGATTPFYNCKSGTKDYYVSTDNSCGNNYVVGVEGYGYSKPITDQAMVPLYRCVSSGLGHFVSSDGECEGSGTGTLLGYALP